MKVSILGAGIAGLSAAIAMRQSGHVIEVFEQADALNNEGTGFVLSSNAISALAVLGLKKKIQDSALTLNHFSIVDTNGKSLLEAQAASYSIQRSELQQILKEDLGSEIQFAKEATGYTELHEKIAIHFEDGTTVVSDYVIVADGINSMIRNKLNPAAKKRYAGYTCWKAIVPNATGLNDIATTTWGTKGRVGIVPLPNNEAYWFACLNCKAGDTTYARYTLADLFSRFSSYHHPVPDIIISTQHFSVIHNDIYDLAPLKKFAYGRFLLIGDAAHASTPNTGQGASQAIEDAAALAQILAMKLPLDECFRQFEKKRIPRVRYISRFSRRLGAIAQLENNGLITLRNTIMRLLPKRVQQSRLDKIHRYKYQ